MVVTNYSNDILSIKMEGTIILYHQIIIKSLDLRQIIIKKQTYKVRSSIFFWQRLPYMSNIPRKKSLVYEPISMRLDLGKIRLIHSVRRLGDSSDF
jgi:hypothetical protein